MKHRSVVLFSVVIMALAVVPEASQQFSELAGVAQNSIKTRIWNALLGLHAQQHEAPETRPVTVAQTSTLQVTELAVRRVRPTGTTARDKSTPAAPRRAAAWPETVAEGGVENGQMVFDVRAVETFEVAMLEALPEVKRRSQSFAREAQERELQHPSEQDMLVDPDTQTLPHESKAKAAVRVVWRFPGPNAGRSGDKRDKLTKIRRFSANELKTVNLSANFAFGLPKATAPTIKVCPSTLTVPAPPVEAGRDYTTDQAFDTNM